jgi:hypothetical protein
MIFAIISLAKLPFDIFKCLRAAKSSPNVDDDETYTPPGSPVNSAFIPDADAPPAPEKIARRVSRDEVRPFPSLDL